MASAFTRTASAVQDNDNVAAVMPGKQQPTATAAGATKPSLLQGSKRR